MPIRAHQRQGWFQEALALTMTRQRALAINCKPWTIKLPRQKSTRRDGTKIDLYTSPGYGDLALECGDNKDK